MANKVTTLIDVNTQDELYPRTKTSAVSDNDGNSLGNVAVCNYTTLSSGTFPVHLGIEMDLLWTNPAPTTTGSKTVQLDLSGYTCVLCNLGATSSNVQRVYCQMIVPKNGVYSWSDGSSNACDIQATDSGVTYTVTVGTCSQRILFSIYGIR